MARPKSGNALSPAEKQRRYRARQAARMEAAIEARVREMGVVIQGGPADMRARGFVEDMLVNAIVVGPEHRTVIETAVAEIAKSVAEIGLTNPVAVRRMEGGRPYLIAGRQRLEAFKRLKRETIRVIVFDDNDMQAKLRKLDENLCRAELSPAEEAAAEYERSHRPARVTGPSRGVVRTD